MLNDINFIHAIPQYEIDVSLPYYNINIITYMFLTNFQY